MLIKIPFNYQGERTQSEYGIRTNGSDIHTLFLDSTLYEQAKFIFRTEDQINRK
jgi:hypothetical protein